MGLSHDWGISCIILTALKREYKSLYFLLLHVNKAELFTFTNRLAFIKSHS